MRKQCCTCSLVLQRTRNTLLNFQFGEPPLPFGHDSWKPTSKKAAKNNPPLLSNRAFLSPTCKALSPRHRSCIPILNAASPAQSPLFTSSILQHADSKCMYTQMPSSCSYRGVYRGADGDEASDGHARCREGCVIVYSTSR